MARRYDSSTTTFSPEGRLHQVEYAIEAINNAGTCIGILAKDGIVMASERRITSGLLAPAKVCGCLLCFELAFYFSYVPNLTSDTLNTPLDFGKDV
jgi:hypothetical protein